MTTVSFHFHGYQPGDIVSWREPDPLKPPAAEERRSPVSLAIGSERIAGRNWTDTVLRTYGRLQTVLDRVGDVASVDIEPQTLVWLLERDPDAYGRVRSAFERGTASLALTPPFHPILPHHHRFERRVLFELMLDFYAPFLRRLPGEAVGLWLPEAAYSRETLDGYARAAQGRTADPAAGPDILRKAHLLLDSRQFADGSKVHGAWASVEGGVPAMGRDHPLSSDFAFGSAGVDSLCDAVAGRGRESVLLASDLESLLANAEQGERFEAIVHGLGSRGVGVRAPRPPVSMPSAGAVDYSSWSDYDEYVHEGHTSDTRWTGLRRRDGLVVPRVHRGVRMSQLWKHAFTRATEQVETAVRRGSLRLLKEAGAPKPPDALRGLAVAYGRHLFQAHFRACGSSAADLDFAAALGPLSGGRLDPEVGGFLGRGYLFMLMGLRSDPRFWDNPDTRVTFQNVGFLAGALVDLSEAFRRMRDGASAERLLRLLKAALAEFSDAYGRWDLGRMRGIESWETTEAAWLESLQSEIPARSGLDVVKRATLFAVGDRLPEGPGIAELRSQGVVADTGHIAGEVHGRWENPGWCEHRSS